jgi:hypothetical protein
VQPSRKTVINELLKCPAFVQTIEHLRSCIAAKLTANLCAQFNDIYPYFNAKMDIYHNEQLANLAAYRPHEDITAIQEQLTQAYTQQHQAEIDDALQQYKCGSIAYEQFRDDYTALEDTISNTDNNKEG